MHLLLVGKAHAARAFAVKQNHIGERAGDDGERFTRFGGIKIAAGGGGAAAFGGDEAVHRAEAFLLIAVEIVGARIAGIHAGLNHGFEKRIGAGLGGGHINRPACAVIGVGTGIAVFGFFEIGQAIEICPVFQPGLLRPMVEIERIAADIAHAVD